MWIEGRNCSSLRVANSVTSEGTSHRNFKLKICYLDWGLAVGEWLEEREMCHLI
jgi:hypothetical protein